jgi:hypothetical protein
MLQSDSGIFCAKYFLMQCIMSADFQSLQESLCETAPLSSLKLTLTGTDFSMNLEIGNSTASPRKITFYILRWTS